MAILQGITDAWMTSSYTNGDGACVEVRSPVPTALHVRDTKDREGFQIAFPANAWQSFVTGVRRGAFHLDA